MPVSNIEERRNRSAEKPALFYCLKGGIRKSLPLRTQKKQPIIVFVNYQNQKADIFVK